MSGCDINDVHAPKHAAPSRWLPVGCLVAALFTSAATVLYSVARVDAGWWFAFVLSVGLMLLGAVSGRRYLIFRVSRVAGERGDTRSNNVRSLPGAGGQLAAAGVKRASWFERRALLAERRTGWASARRARTTPIDDE